MKSKKYPTKEKVHIPTIKKLLNTNDSFSNEPNLYAIISFLLDVCSSNINTSQRNEIKACALGVPKCYSFVRMLLGTIEVHQINRTLTLSSQPIGILPLQPTQPKNIMANQTTLKNSKKIIALNLFLSSINHIKSL